MKSITYSRCLLAVTAITLLALAACSKQPASNVNAVAASAPTVAASTPTVQTAASAATERPDETDENGGSTRPTAQSQGSASGPRIKGIALGESPDEVHQALSTLLPVGNPCQVSPDAVRVVCESTAQQLQGSFVYESGKLTSFKFYSGLTTLVFGQMPFNDFVQNFMKAYDIGHMDPAQDNPMFSQYLRYRDDSGWEAGIYPDNTFYVKSIATASQQAKSFN
ncbi:MULTISPECIES: hypothetical protein [Paraburkholderia]|uniref:hypothetical protein n=1 Tax=Paraburkholderia TaxID=1822464 RepID=UPI0022587214|nr:MULTISPECIES: hypothetical protein [Paraburkholderia]MCX4166315.1 hypothetical protein [Paraburkholderia megapolitana]MDN7161805.1 hypothetical protein [Paraburkholderia sp. CHISQ3]MDQ6498853.1 hypothetical protein [Paraburkholderia megapolitana]